MKRWLSLLLSLLLALMLAGCGALESADLPVQTPPPASDTEATLPTEEDTSPESPPEVPPEVLPEAPPENEDGDGGEDGDWESLPEGSPISAPCSSDVPELVESLVDEDGNYTSKDDVALYIHLYGHLPSNFITKKEAQALGWSGGSLEPYAPGKCIGGSRFGNYEGLLPEAEGRTYTECDIDTLGADRRGAKRIVFSNDGLIYYTGDHYESFTLLYGDEP